MAIAPRDRSSIAHKPTTGVGASWLIWVNRDLTVQTSLDRLATCAAVMSHHLLSTGADWLTTSGGTESFASGRRNGGIEPKKTFGSYNKAGR